MRLPLVLAAPCLLAACAAPLPERGEFVPFQEVLAETKGQPLECSQFDPRSETCVSFGTTEIRGNRLIGNGVAVLDVAGVMIDAQISAQGELRQGAACIDADSWRIDFPKTERSVVAPEILSVFKAFLEADLGAAQDSCAYYFRTKGPAYLVAYAPPGDDINPADLEEVRFFGEQPNLRPLQR